MKAEGGAGANKWKWGNFYGEVYPSATLLKLPNYFSLFWCRKSFMICTT